MAKKESELRQLPRPKADAWQLQEAKARLSELFSRARSHGPQRITRHGKEAVVVLPAEQYERLLGVSEQPRSLVEFFAASPLVNSGLRLERKREYGRKVVL